MDERLDCLPAGDRASSRTWDERLAETRLSLWRDQDAFKGRLSFEERLAAEDVQLEDMRFLLGESIDSLASRHESPPPWARRLIDAFESVEQRSSSLPEGLQFAEPSGFLFVISPLVQSALESLRARVQDLRKELGTTDFLAISPEALFLPLLGLRLEWILSRALVVELNLARLEGKLRAGNAKERFEEFIDSLRSPETALSILHQYPVLARQCTTFIDDWLESSVELLQRLFDDRDSIRRAFGENNPGALIGVQGGLGDRHRGGRTVTALEFSSGLRLVYKPKSLSVDAHFQELLRWLNGFVDLEFRPIKILARESYGWSEYVPHESCRSARDVENFYRRQGGYLALLYALGATDFHSENIVAYGEHPILVDLESLFYQEEPLNTSRISASETIATRAAIDSVLRVGLLPRRILGDGERTGIDISGLLAMPGQQSPVPTSNWDGMGQDDVHLVAKQAALGGSLNRPSLDGIDMDVFGYVDAVTEGFEDIYRILLDRRVSILSEGGILESFKDDVVRCIVRPTFEYAIYLANSSHPFLLRDALDKDRHFERLWIGCTERPFLKTVVKAEREDLNRGDIPIFTTRPGSRHIWSSGGLQIPNAFMESGLDATKRKIARISDRDLKKQVWIIKASLAALEVDRSEALQYPSYRWPGAESTANDSDLWSAALAVGSRLNDLAFRAGHDATWIGITSRRGRNWSVAPVGPNLYDGLGGIALFLGYLGALTDQNHFTELAQAAIRTMLSNVRSGDLSLPVGGFWGWGGIVHAFGCLGHLWDLPSLFSEAERIVASLPAWIDQDNNFDIIAGSAGCILALLSFHAITGRGLPLEVAVQCGERLVDKSVRIGSGIGWPYPEDSSIALSGFAHGAAGISYALLRLTETTGDERFRSAALKAIDYERSLFSSQVGNWKDLRKLDRRVLATQVEKDSYMTYWCHGAAGIGLARINLENSFQDQSFRDEAIVAIKATLRDGFGRNHSLCHGDLGNAELLIQAASTWGEPRWNRELERLRAGILTSIRDDGWISGLPLGLEDPGLMMGLSGIGYGLLRLAAPGSVPCVLLLEAPGAVAPTARERTPQQLPERSPVRAEQ